MSALSSISSLRGSRVVRGTTRKDTPGASSSSWRASPPMSSAAVASAMASTKVLLARCGAKALGTMAACSWRKASRTLGHKASARGVGSIP